MRATIRENGDIEIHRDDRPGSVEVVDVRPALAAGQRHEGPTYRATKDKARVEAVYEVATIPPEQADDDAAAAFITSRLPTVLGKARAVMADPVNAPDFTAVERKVILAAVLLDLNQRRR